jgi:phosphoserine phosphatase
VNGVFTGKSLRPCYGRHKADAVRELAARDALELGISTGYSDSYNDLAFLEAIGKPVAINPDRRLRRTARVRGWPILRFEELLSPAGAVVKATTTLGRGS